MDNMPLIAPTRALFAAKTAARPEERPREIAT
jgi:hypothetical protein